MIRRDFYGYRYDTIEPSFMTAGMRFYWHRPARQLLGKQAVDTEMVAANYFPAPGEIGDASPGFRANHFSLPLTTGGGPPTNRPGTGPVTGTGTIPGLGTGTTPATTGAIPGTPGVFRGPVPADLAALQALGPLGNTTAWTTGQSIDLGNGSSAYWDGTNWQLGVVPAPTTTTGVRAGYPGSFQGVVPADIAALQALGALGQTTAWDDRRIGTIQQWVQLGAPNQKAVWAGPGNGWQFVTPAQLSLDVTALIANGPSGWPGGVVPADLATLKADPQAGDGRGYQADGTFGIAAVPAVPLATGFGAIRQVGVAFAIGQYVVLGDGSHAFFSGTVSTTVQGAWMAGEASYVTPYTS